MGRPAGSCQNSCEDRVVIRAARTDDVDLLSAIERAAGAQFHDVGLPSIAEDEPFSVAELLLYVRDGRAWVATDDRDRPVAYLLLDVVEGAAHIEQVSVHPDHARRGVGRALIDAADEWAGQHGLTALTLTTFADVPWNAPYYARLGFTIIADDSLTDGLRRIREHEVAAGIEVRPRVAMTRPVGPVGPGEPGRPSNR